MGRFSQSESNDRRAFLKAGAAAAASAWLDRALAAASSNAVSRIVRIHRADATETWDYSANAPWDHTVEPREGLPGKTEKRYFECIRPDIVKAMLDRGLRELTDQRSALEAWRTLMPGLSRAAHITIKVNLNNATYDPLVTNNRLDQTMPLVNAVLDHLVAGLGIAEENIVLLDAQRWFHPVIMKGRCRYPNVKWVDSTVPDRWDRRETVVFTAHEPLPGGNFWMPKAYTGADHILNLCLMKTHGCGITGAMKNHFGAIPSPKCLHEGLGTRSYIADLCNTPSIRGKVRINIADALFANWHNNVWAPRPWKSFPEESPNSLFLGTDPVALDSLMLDHIIREVEMQGDNAPGWLRERLAQHDFLEYAMKVHRLGIHEHPPYRQIEYREIEA